ncbi:MAG: Tetratricopeptide 2 repeat protein [Deltaproteobacteria bacterium]|nr:Tetratricopeptide 2 repeat protein [Deltaproteobacteria bacterium]
MKWLSAVVVLLATTQATAQSKRYPPEPVDKDDEAAAKSGLWESATNPQRTPYESMLAEAQQSLDDRNAEGAQDAVKKLGEAIKLMPDDPRAYRMRGEAAMTLKDWAGCAADFANATVRGRSANAEPKATAELRRRLGLCQARAGKLASAERTLAEAAASGASSGEVWMRLGEVRIALGKLEEAIAALEAAAEQNDVSQPLVRWLLAGAYDRARRPSEAIEAGRRALAADRELTTLKNPSLPLLGIGEAEYLLGLAHSIYDPPHPEFSLLYFRRFLTIAPDSPWRRRAEDHLRELKTTEFPEVVEKRGGNALLDVTIARTVVRKLMPQMRACMAKLPNTVMEVALTKAGPRTPVTPGMRRSFAPPEGITILPNDTIDKVSPPARAELDSAIRCIEPLAMKIVLPPIKDKDAYYKAVFSVIGP